MTTLRSIISVLVIVVLLHVLAAGVFAGWLYVDGRLNEQRLRQVVQIFQTTVQEETDQQALASKLEQEATQVAQEAARLEMVAQRGPTNLQERLSENLQRSEIADQNVARIRREIEDLRRRLDLAKQYLQEEHQKLNAERAAFEAAKQTDIARRNDEDFKRAVQMIEGLKPKLAKEHFQQLLASNKLDETVNYLAAMQPRKAIKVLGEFKTEEELGQANLLIERLRQRGVVLDGAVADRRAPGAGQGG